MLTITRPQLLWPLALLLLSSCEMPSDQPSGSFEIRSASNEIGIYDRDVVTWNKVPVTLNELEQLLAQTKRMQPEPSLLFTPELTADYDVSAEVLQTIKQSGVTNFGFVGNEYYEAPSD